MRGIMFKQARNTALAIALAALFCLALAPATARAAGTDADKLAELQQKLEQSLKMIQALNARVQALEADKARGPAADTAATTPPPPEAQRIEAVESKVAQIETANASRRADD